MQEGAALIEVVLGPLWVLVLFDEVPTAGTLIGGAIIMTAVIVQALAGRRADGHS